MPRPMLKTSQKIQTEASSLLNAAQITDQKVQSQQMNQMELDRILRRPRSKKYMDALHKLDAGGHVHNHHKTKEIIDAIKEEFPEISICDIMLGMVSVCYLGAPYEVHTLNVIGGGGIIEHYKAGQPLPNGLEKARMIAMHGSYDFIEVYAGCCRAVSANGNVSVITC